MNVVCTPIVIIGLTNIRTLQSKNEAILFGKTAKVDAMGS